MLYVDQDGSQYSHCYCDRQQDLPPDYYLLGDCDTDGLRDWSFKLPLPGNLLCIIYVVFSLTYPLFSARAATRWQQAAVTRTTRTQLLCRLPAAVTVAVMVAATVAAPVAATANLAAVTTLVVINLANLGLFFYGLALVVCLLSRTHGPSGYFFVRRTYSLLVCINFGVLMHF